MTPTNSVAPIAAVEVVTTEQLGRASDRFIARCRKNEVSLPKVASQEVLEQEGDELAQEMFEVFRNRVERRSKMIVRHATVNYDLTPEELFDLTGRKQYLDKDKKTLKTLPRQGRTGVQEVDVHFFNEGRYLTIDEQEKVLASYGLVPEYYGQVQVNIDDPSFADEHPNGAQWDNDRKQASFVAFSRGDGGRYVGCGRGGGWGPDCWFAGRRKS